MSINLKTKKYWKFIYKYNTDELYNIFGQHISKIPVEDRVHYDFEKKRTRQMDIGAGEGVVYDYYFAQSLLNSADPETAILQSNEYIQTLADKSNTLFDFASELGKYIIDDNVGDVEISIMTRFNKCIKKETVSI